jgi:hypothetical protein
MRLLEKDELSGDEAETRGDLKSAELLVDEILRTSLPPADAFLFHQHSEHVKKLRKQLGPDH